MHDIKVIVEETNKDASKKYFVFPNYGSNQNQETYGYQI